MKRVGLTLLSLVLAVGIWLPSLRLVYRIDRGEVLSPSGVAPRARALANGQLRLWRDPDLRAREVAAMRRSNAEWDFMGRTFFVLALANLAILDPGRSDEYLSVIDFIVEETLRVEGEHGHLFFLMDYGRDGPFVLEPARSLFVDGEIALMVGARRLVSEKAEWKPLFEDRVALLVDRMEKGPILCAESYPDECWLFCNTVALAAMRLSDRLDGRDHAAFLRRWVASAREHLVDPGTGILISSFRLSGARKDGPEGSSIWMAAHCLELVDEAFARDQYQRARKALGRTLLGFSFAREWPAGREGPVDIDSGPVIPFLEASPGSSGLALLGAASFHDDEFLLGLVASLDFAGFPMETEGSLRYGASNAVGDAVLLYALVQGPLWARAKEGRRP